MFKSALVYLGFLTTGLTAFAHSDVALHTATLSDASGTLATIESLEGRRFRITLVWDAEKKALSPFAKPVGKKLQGVVTAGDFEALVMSRVSARYAVRIATLRDSTDVGALLSDKQSYEYHLAAAEREYNRAPEYDQDRLRREMFSYREKIRILSSRIARHDEAVRSANLVSTTEQGTEEVYRKEASALASEVQEFFECLPASDQDFCSTSPEGERLASWLVDAMKTLEARHRWESFKAISVEIR